MEWRDANTGQIKTWVWAVAAFGFVIFLFVIGKVVGGGQTGSGGTIPVGGQSSDITDYLSQLNDSLTDLNGTGNTAPTPTPTPTPTPDPNARTWKKYTVVKNDTWETIAGKFGMTLTQLFEKNPTLRNLGTPTTPRQGGREIFVWDVAPKTATPKKFTLTRSIDTWREVAQRNNISLERFYQLNPTLDTRRERRADYERKAGREVVVGTSYT
jgi:LysM repeat protein